MRLICHNRDMNRLTIPEPHQCYVVIGGRTAASRLLDLAARLAIRGPLLLLDCGNRANPLPIVRELRRLTNDPVRALGQIQTARAFTCYQAAALLEEAARRPMSYPVLIVDLLATFYDESVTLREGNRLLEQSLRCITQIHAAVPSVISAQPPRAAFPERAHFLEKVIQLADLLWVEDLPALRQPQQLSFLD